MANTPFSEIRSRNHFRILIDERTHSTSSGCCHAVMMIMLMSRSAKNQNPRKILNFILKSFEKQMVPCKGTAIEVSFEWSHHRISSTDSKVRTTLHVFIIDSGS